ncbi:MAG: hypothetical protein AB2392_19870 [Neobacillus sp.]
MHNNKNGVYICLEGIKGAGKTTVFNNLVSKLRENNVEFSTVSPTRSSGEVHFIERLFKKYPSLKSKRLPRIFLYGHRSNYAAINANWNMPLILGERSIATSYATKWSHSSIRNWLNFGIINVMENKIRTPDYVIYIDVPHDILKDRIESRDKERDMDDSVTRLKEMEEAYMEMMINCKIKRMSNVKWIRVSGVESPDAVCDNILELITQLSNSEKTKEPLIS